MNSAPQVPIIGVLVLALIGFAFIAVIAVLVTWAIKTRSVGAVIGAIAVVMFALLLIALIVPAVSVVRTESEGPVSAQIVQTPDNQYATPPPMPPMPPSHAWLPEVSGAGIYSSPDKAVSALTELLATDFAQQHAENPSSISIRIAPRLNEWVPTIGPLVERQLQQSFPTTEVDVDTMNHEAQSKDDAFVLSIDAMDLTRASNAPWDSARTHVKGEINFSAKYMDFQFDGSKAFVEKPWVEQFDEYISQRPGRRLFRAVSSDFGLSPQEAEQSARNVAALILASQIRPADLQMDRSMMAGVIMNTLDANRLIVDRFSQERDTSSGNKVWQTALLIDADPSKLSNVVNQYHHEKIVENTKRQSGIGGIALLAVLVVILYFVMNEFTKGYFVWNLRVSAMMLMLCLAVAFCWWIKIT